MQSSVQQKSFRTQNVVQTDDQENSRIRTPIFSGGLRFPTAQNLKDNLGSLHKTIC